MNQKRKRDLINKYLAYEEIAREIMGSYTFNGIDPKYALIQNLAIIDLIEEKTSKEKK